MSARRPHGQSYAEVAAKSPQENDTDVTPAVPAHVIYKLLGFTAAMVFAPIGMYFLTVNSIFGGEIEIMSGLQEIGTSLTSTQGNATYSGITAAITANVVLFAYIYVAWKEDQGDQQEARKALSKKGQ
ncbi:Vacuolar ATPase assembly integral membrane protein vma21 [Penicillium verhagenii]|nr:Vacuolar ATPase assembly integral membrane protein vma21 [Penicillium verhagenii]